MREKKEYTVITFYTTAAAMFMEEYCNTHGIKGRLIPVPREISAGCGLAYRILPEEWKNSESSIKDSNVEIEQITNLFL